MYLHFGHIYSEMGKENKLAFRNYIIYLPKKSQKIWNEMRTKPCIEQWDEEEWDENETLHLTMMMVKKLYRKTIYKTLFTKIIYIKKINKKFNYYPPSPCFLFLCLSLKIEIK